MFVPGEEEDECIFLAPQSFALVFNKRALLRNKNSFLNLKIISRVSNLVN